MSVPSRPAVRLVCVSADNHNKVYEMSDAGDGTFTARFGRIGARLQERRYSVARWDALYREKTRKGYRDLTPLAADPAVAAGFDVPDLAVAAFVQRLRAAADRALTAQYLVAPGEVGAGQVAEAQDLLDALAGLAAGLDGSPEPAAAFDAALVALYTVIPRRMADVRRHLVGHGLPVEDVSALLDAEQEALDRMAQRVRLAEAPRRPTLAEALGADLRPVDTATADAIRTRMGHHAHRFVQAFEVTHPAQRARFNAHVATARRRKTALLWHGSGLENWLPIVEQGLCLHPARAQITGRMFGHGLYFADTFEKSFGYTSRWGGYRTAGGEARGVVGLYDVHLGHVWTVRLHLPEHYALSADTLPRRGLGHHVDSVHARRGLSLRNDEFVVYREAQACPLFLVDVTLD